MKFSLFAIIFCCYFLPLSLLAQTTLEDYNIKYEYISSKIPGTINLRAIGFAKKKNNSIENAARGAIYAVLFHGISGSPYSLPMINNESEQLKNPIVRELLENGYKSFFTSMVNISEEKKIRKFDGIKGIETVNEFTINIDAIRKYLEQNNIIRKFGL